MVVARDRLWVIMTGYAGRTLNMATTQVPRGAAHRGADWRFQGRLVDEDKAKIRVRVRVKVKVMVRVGEIRGA